MFFRYSYLYLFLACISSPLFAADKYYAERCAYFSDGVSSIVNAQCKTGNSTVHAGTCSYHVTIKGSHRFFESCPHGQNWGDYDSDGDGLINSQDSDPYSDSSEPSYTCSSSENQYRYYSAGNPLPNLCLQNNEGNLCWASLTGQSSIAGNPAVNAAYTLNGNVCGTTDQPSSVPPVTTSEQTCVLDGNFWHNSSCLTPQQYCEDVSGLHWYNDQCNAQPQDTGSPGSNAGGYSCPDGKSARYVGKNQFQWSDPLTYSQVLSRYQQSYSQYTSAGWPTSELRVSSRSDSSSYTADYYLVTEAPEGSIRTVIARVLCGDPDPDPDPDPGSGDEDGNCDPNERVCPKHIREQTDALTAKIDEVFTGEFNPDDSSINESVIDGILQDVNDELSQLFNADKLTQWVDDNFSFKLFSISDTYKQIIGMHECQNIDIAIPSLFSENVDEQFYFDCKAANELKQILFFVFAYFAVSSVFNILLTFSLPVQMK